MLQDLIGVLAECYTTKCLRYFKLMDLAERWRKMDWKFFQDAWDKFIVLRVTNMHDFAIPKAPFDLFTRIFNTMDENTLPYYIKLMKDDWEGSTWPYVMVSYFHKEILHGLPIRIIGLDGTANAGVWNRILGKECNFVKVGMKYENVWQLSNAGYPISTYMHGKTITEQGMKLLRLAAKVAKKNASKTLLVGSMRLKPHVEEVMGKTGLQYSYATYYNLRSMNKFMDCDNVILLMRPSPPEEVVSTYTVLSGWEEDVWRGFFTKDEMLQAIARIRQNIKNITSKSLGTFGDKRAREIMNVYVFSKEPIFDEKDIYPGNFHYWSRTRFEYFLDTDADSIGAMRNDSSTRAEIFGMLSDGKRLSLNDILASVKYKAAARRVIKRACALDELTFTGGTYGRV